MTAKFPKRDGEFEYHIRSTDERYEGMARESEPGAIDDKVPTAKAAVEPKGKRKTGRKGKR